MKNRELIIKTLALILFGILFSFIVWCGNGGNGGNGGSGDNGETGEIIYNPDYFPKFVAVGSGDKAAYSDDGINWSSESMPVMPRSANWYSVCYGDGKFVAVGNGPNNIATDKAAYFKNGKWIETTLKTSAKWYSVCYGNGKFVAVAGKPINKAAYSTDGINWNSADMPSSANWVSVCYGGGMFIAVSTGGDKTAYSTNGTNWTQASMPASGNWRSVCYGNGKFVAVSFGGISTAFYDLPMAMAAYSTNGTSWTFSAVNANEYWESVCYGNGRFVAVSSLTESLRLFARTTVKSNRVAYSSYEIIQASFMPALTRLLLSNISGTTVQPSITGAVAYSTDGNGWNAKSMPYVADWSSVCYGNGKFVAVGENVCAYSTDGITWSKGPILSDNVDLYSVCCSGD